MNNIKQLIKFEPESDEFQKKSYEGINNEKVVLSNAPTGSGKTRIIFYACAYYLNKGDSVAVTIPIKALSNQKYREFIDDLIPKLENQLGKSFTVGIMTGDTIINPEADLIVLTTEILNESLNCFGDKKGEKKTTLKKTFIERLGCVVFDEAHYINDEDRGNVWESILIKLDKNINTVLLSATFPNVNYISEWLCQVRKREVSIILKKDRAVPLNHYLYNDYNDTLQLIMDSNNHFYQSNYDKVIHNGHYSKGIQILNNCVNYLKENNLLQAIFFVFSKKNCEKMAQQINNSLIDYDERAEIEKIYNSKMYKHEKEYSNTPQFCLAKKLLLKGICFHHAEVIPVLKEIIEILFSKGLIKILFVTETFSVGLNMPTKTVVFTSLIKPTKKGMRLLLPHEYNQMSGRAGRRGKDLIGHVIHIPYYKYHTNMDTKNVLHGNMLEIKSKMKIDYSFILKIYASKMNIINFLERSLFSKELNKDIKIIETELENINKKLPSYDNIDDLQLKEYKEYLKLLNISKQFGEGLFTVRLSKKQSKRKTILSNKYDKDCNFIKFKNSENIINIKKEKEKELNYIKNEIPNKIKKIENILKKFKFMEDDNNINMHGIIAAQINEFNPIILSSMLMYDNDITDSKSPYCMLYGLEAEEIVALLSIFIKNNNKNEVYLEDIECTENIKDRIYKIKELINYYYNIEENYIDNDDYWELSYSNIEAVYKWAKGGNFVECLQLLNETNGGGSFIKNTIRINNTVNDLISLCKICMNTKLLTELSKIEQIILRDQITVKSLYIE